MFDPSRSLKSWLIVIMRNRFFDVVVAGRKTLQDVDGYHASRLSTGPNQQASVEYRQTLDLIDQLPRLYRQAMHAVVLNGLSYDHASQLFRCPIPTIKSRVQRARKALKDVIAA